MGSRSATNQIKNNGTRNIKTNLGARKLVIGYAIFGQRSSKRREHLHNLGRNRGLDSGCCKQIPVAWVYITSVAYRTLSIKKWMSTG